MAPDRMGADVFGSVHRGRVEMIRGEMVLSTAKTPYFRKGTGSNRINLDTQGGDASVRQQLADVIR